MKQPDWLKMMGSLEDRYIEEALLFGGYGNSSPKAKEKRAMKHTQNRKASLYLGKLAAVIALIAALGITAYATGIVDSVIAKIADNWAVYDEAQGTRHEAAGEKSNKEPDSRNLTQMDGAVMTIEESYYDGESLMLVYSLDSAKQLLSFDFAPDSEDLGNLEKREGWTLESLRMEYDISEEDYQILCKKLETDGKVGFRVKRTGLGDHVLLTDGTDLGPMMGTELDGKLFLECQDGLPEEAQNRQQLEIEFKVRCWDICFYVDGDNIFQFRPAPEEEKVVFTVKNCNIP